MNNKCGAIQESIVHAVKIESEFLIQSQSIIYNIFTTCLYPYANWTLVCCLKFSFARKIWLTQSLLIPGQLSLSL